MSEPESSFGKDVRSGRGPCGYQRRSVEQLQQTPGGTSEISVQRSAVPGPTQGPQAPLGPLVEDLSLTEGRNRPPREGEWRVRSSNVSVSARAV